MNYQNVLEECIALDLLKSKMGDKNKPIKRSSVNNLSTNKIKRFEHTKEGKFELKLDQVIAFKPCFHKGNEPCSGFNCECQKRGFCEKYCVCNKELCKQRFKGCNCETGNCLINTCSCYGSGRECDPDLCTSIYNYI